MNDFQGFDNRNNGAGIAGTLVGVLSGTGNKWRFGQRTALEPHRPTSTGFALAQTVNRYENCNMVRFVERTGSGSRRLHTSFRNSVFSFGSGSLANRYANHLDTRFHLPFGHQENR